MLQLRQRLARTILLSSLLLLPVRGFCAAMPKVKRIVIVPGNGCVPVERCNWYAWMRDRAVAEGLAETVELRNMPDPYTARETVWLPFMVDQMGAGEDTVLVGHSSGAVAAMRLCEQQKLAGVLLVSACHTDLGDENERASGYYSRPWQWDAIRRNAGALVQMHSLDDPLIPCESEARHVATSLGLAAEDGGYREVRSRSHFFDKGDDLLEALRDVVSRANGDDGGNS